LGWVRSWITDVSYIRVSIALIRRCAVDACPDIEVESKVLAISM